MATPTFHSASTPSGLSSPLLGAALHAGDREQDRLLAWVNSICLAILIAGFAGSRPARARLKEPPPLEGLSAMLAEPLPPPPQLKTEVQTLEPNDEAAPDAPRVVAVTLETPATVFAVPTVGNLLVPGAVAQAPPAIPMKTVATLPKAPPPAPTVLKHTGSGGVRPAPPYPKIALEQAQQGTVVLAIAGNDAGAIVEVQVSESSGFPVLDRAALDWVKRHWSVPSGTGAHAYVAKITYKLSNN